MGFIKNFPLFAIVLIAYNIVAFLSNSDVSLQNNILFELTLISGAVVNLSIDSVMILFGIVVMFIELIKSTRSTAASAIDHGLSTLVFIAFLLEFLLVKQVGTSGFLIIMTLSLLDVIAGFTVTISSARRDVVLDQ